MPNPIPALALILACATMPARAQKRDDLLFGTKRDAPRQGVMLAANGGIDAPGGDMAKRFGTSFRVGPSLIYRRGAYYFGAKFDYIFGNRVNEDSLAYNIQNADGSFTGADGYGVGIGVFQRGYAVGLMAGKSLRIFPHSDAEHSVLLMAGAGFLQHRIRFEDKNNQVPALRKEYRQGYDRLSNGIYGELSASYQYFSPEGFLNFYIGPTVMAGFTQGRRTWWYDVNRAGNDKRLDLLFGLRAGIYIPFSKRRSDDLYFE